MYGHPPALSPNRARPVPALLQMRPQPGADSRRRILVPVDGSRTSEAALSHVMALARSMPLTVHLLNAQAPVMAGEISLFMTATMVQARRRAAGERVLQRARGMLAAARIEHTAEVAIEVPAAAIVRSAAVNGCDKIVMATRNRNFLDALVRPSVARRVVKLAAIPVTIVKAALVNDHPPAASTAGGSASDCASGGNALVQSGGLIG